MSRDRGGALATFLTVIAGVVAVALVGGLLIGGCAGVKSFQRSQKRADANNNVKVTAINIRRAQQQAKITAANDANIQALADQRVIEAKGIKTAQDIISSTLTTKYLQHEAIKAQLAMATGQNHTVVYVPSGDMGVPLIQNATSP